MTTRRAFLTFLAAVPVLAAAAPAFAARAAELPPAGGRLRLLVAPTAALADAACRTVAARTGQNERAVLFSGASLYAQMAPDWREMRAASVRAVPVVIPFRSEPDIMVLAPSYRGADNPDRSSWWASNAAVALHAAMCGFRATLGVVAVGAEAGLRSVAAELPGHHFFHYADLGADFGAVIDEVAWVEGGRIGGHRIALGARSTAA